MKDIFTSQKYFVFTKNKYKSILVILYCLVEPKAIVRKITLITQAHYIKKKTKYPSPLDFDIISKL